MTQIEPEEITVESVGGDLLEPEVVTILNEATESSYIKMNNMSFVDASQWAGDGSSFNVDIMDGDGNMFVMRIDNDSELSTMSAPDAPFNVVGIGGQFDRNEPLDEGYQIFPFFASIIVITLLPLKLRGFLGSLKNRVNFISFLLNTLSGFI